MRVRTLSFCAAVLAVAACGDDANPNQFPDANVDAPADSMPGSAILSLDRTNHPFDDVTVGQSATTTFTLSNTGTVESGVPSVSVIGADASEFAASGCDAALVGGAQCTVTVTFTPTSAGAKSGRLLVGATPGGNEGADLTGTGVAAGALTLVVTTPALGDAVVRATGTTSVATVTNTGEDTTGPLNLQLAGSNPVDFTITDDECTGETLATGEDCTFTIGHTPRSPGAKAATLHVSGAPGGVVTAGVTARGQAPAQLVPVGTRFDFGSVEPGTTSAPLSITLTNVGDVASDPVVLTLASTEFTLAGGTCDNAAVAPGTTCTIDVTFSPGTGGATAVFADNLGVSGGFDGAFFLGLVGRGAPATFTVDKPRVAFAPLAIGGTASASALTFTNSDASTVGPLLTSLKGPGASQFAVVAGTDTCNNATLGTGESCSLSVTFAPTASGVPAAEVIVAADPSAMLTTALHGVALPPAALAITPAARDFGSVIAGQNSAPLTFTVTNVGGQATGLPTVMLGGTDVSQFANAGSTCGAALAPRQSCTVQIRFQPTSPGAKAASVQVAATPGGTATATFTGEGIGNGQLVVIPAAFSFGPNVVGDAPITRTVTVFNAGAVATTDVELSASGTELVIDSDTCATLEPGAACTATVTFTPTAAGARTSTLTATATTGGTATAAFVVTGVPALEMISIGDGIVPALYDYGSEPAGREVVPPVWVQYFVRNNRSTSQNLTIASSNTTDFQIAGALCQTGPGFGIVPAYGVCGLAVAFVPETAGTKTSTLTARVDATTAVTQDVTGNAVDGLSIIALDGADFGAQAINTSSTARRFRVVNAAEAPTTGPLSTDLLGDELTTTNDGCTGTTLAANESCEMTLTFDPTTAGAVTGELSATASPGGTPSVELSGEGVAPTGAAPTDITLDPSSIAENSPAGSLVGTLSATDTDAGDTFTFALVPGTGATDNSVFTITGTEVHANSPFDFESKATYSIRVRVTDSGNQVHEEALAITVTDVNEPGVATDDSATTLEDGGGVTITVLDNDTDPEGDALEIESVTMGANGTVSVIDANTAVRYVPDPDFFGTDTFTYTLVGGDMATVTVTVQAVDDDPIAVDDAFTREEDTGPHTFDVLANDDAMGDGGPVAIVAVTQSAAGGTVTFTATDVTFAPPANFSGVATFTYTLDGTLASVGTVTVDITPVDDPPVANDDAITIPIDSAATTIAVLDNDTDIDMGPRTITTVGTAQLGTVAIAGDALSLSYTPDPATCGVDTFEYTLDPGGDSATVTVTIPCTTDVGVTIAQGDLTAGLATTYTVRVTNTGPVAASGTVSLPLPSPLTPGSWECSSAANNMCSGNGSGSLADVPFALQPTAFAELTVTANVPSSATGMVTATATIGLDTGVADTMPLNNAAMVTSAVSLVADIALAADTLETDVEPGQIGGVLFTITNNGPSDVAVVDFTATLSAGFTSGIWQCVGGTAMCPPGTNTIQSFTGTVLAQPFSIPSGTELIIAVGGMVTATPGSTVSVSAVALPMGVADMMMANNSAMGSLPVVEPPPPAPDLEVTIIGDSYVVGQATQYGVLIRNIGTVAATGAAIMIDVPSVIQTPSWTCTSGTGPCGADTGDVMITRDIAVGEVIQLEIAGSVLIGTGPFGVSASATIAGDPDPTNNIANATLAAPQPPNLAITVNSPLDQATVGTPVPFGVVVSNPSATDVADVAFTYSIPGAAQIQLSDGTPGWNCTSTGPFDGVCTLAMSPLLAGVPAPPVNLLATGAAPMPLTLTATASGVPGASVSASDTVSITAGPDLAVTAAGVRLAGGERQFTITASNLGPSPSADPTVNVTFSPNLGSITHGSLDGWTCTGAAPSFACTKGLFVGSNEQIVFTAATATLPGPWTVNAVIASPASDDPNPANNMADAAVQPVSAIALDIGSDTIASPGISFTRTATVTNTGETPLSFVQIGVQTGGEGGAAVLSASPAGWSCSAPGPGPVVICELPGILGPGGSAGFDVTVTPGASSFLLEGIALTGSGVQDFAAINVSVVAVE